MQHLAGMRVDAQKIEPNSTEQIFYLSTLYSELSLDHNTAVLKKINSG